MAIGPCLLALPPPPQGLQLSLQESQPILIRTQEEIKVMARVGQGPNPTPPPRDRFWNGRETEPPTAHTTQPHPPARISTRARVLCLGCPQGPGDFFLL